MRYKTRATSTRGRNTRALLQSSLSGVSGQVGMGRRQLQMGGCRRRGFSTILTLKVHTHAVVFSGVPVVGGSIQKPMNPIGGCRGCRFGGPDCTARAAACTRAWRTIPSYWLTYLPSHSCMPTLTDIRSRLTHDAIARPPIGVLPHALHCYPRTHDATRPESLPRPAAATPSNARVTLRSVAHLNTLPSAHSYALPLTSTGLSHAHWSSTNFLSSSLLGSSLVKS